VQSIDDASGFFTSAGDANYPQDSYNLKAERGRSNFDVRNRFSFSYSTDLPVGRGHSFLGDRGWISGFLAGWQTHGIVTMQTGRPFTVALRGNRPEQHGPGEPGLGETTGPMLSVMRRYLDKPGTVVQPGSVRLSSLWHFGNSGRNILDDRDCRT
jgi:hypothetical protein